MHQPLQLGLSCAWMSRFLVGEEHPAAACTAGHFYKPALPELRPSPCCWSLSQTEHSNYLLSSTLGVTRAVRGKLAEAAGKAEPDGFGEAAQKMFPHEPSSLFLLLHNDVVLLIAEERLIFIKM